MRKVISKKVIQVLHKENDSVKAQQAAFFRHGGPSNFNARNYFINKARNGGSW